MQTNNLLKNLSKEELLGITQNKINQRYNLLICDWIDWLSSVRPQLKNLLEIEAYEQCAVLRDEVEKEIKQLIPFVLNTDSIIRYTSEEWVEECLRMIITIVDIHIDGGILSEPNVESTEEVLLEFLKWANETTIKAATIYEKDPNSPELNKFRDHGFVTEKTNRKQLIKLIETN